MAIRFVLVSVLSAAVGVGVTTIHFQRETSELERQLLSERQMQVQRNAERRKALESAPYPGNLAEPFKRF